MKSKGFISVLLIALLLFGTDFSLGYVFAGEEPGEGTIDIETPRDIGEHVKDALNPDLGMRGYDDPVEIETNPNNFRLYGEINWEDRHNAQGMRPEKDNSKLTLKANGVEVNWAPNWIPFGFDDTWDFYVDLPLWDDANEFIDYKLSIGDHRNYKLTKTELIDVEKAYFHTAFYASPRKSLNIGSGDRFAVIKIPGKYGYIIWSEKGITDDMGFISPFVGLVGDKYEQFSEVSVGYVIKSGPLNEDGISISQVGGDWVIEFGDEPNQQTEFIYGSFGLRTVQYTYFTETEKRRPLQVTKHWEGDSEDERPDQIEVVIKGTIGEDENEEVFTLKDVITKADGWTRTWPDLDNFHKGEGISYHIYEEKIPGYYSHVSMIMYGDDIRVGHIVNMKSMFIEGEKYWNDDDDRDGVRPEEITLKLIGTVKKTEVFNEEFTIKASDDWKWKLEVPISYQGQDVEYNLTERQIEYYESDVMDYHVTNTHEPAVRDFTVEKKWVGGETLRPKEIKVQLYANDKKLGEEVVLKAPDWKHTWKDLYVNEKGKPIEYTVKEVSVPKGFVGSYLAIDNGVSITNTYAIPHTDVTAEKKWHNAPDEKPDIWFKLYRQLKGGKPEEVPGAEVLKVKDNKASWTGIEETDKEGNGYSFSAKEVDKDGKDYVPEGYEKEEKGLVVTNSFTKKPDKKPLPSTGQKGTPLLIGGGVILLAAAFVFLRKSKSKA